MHSSLHFLHENHADFEQEGKISQTWFLVGFSIKRFPSWAIPTLSTVLQEHYPQRHCLQ